MRNIRGLSVPSVRLVTSYIFDWIVIMYVINQPQSNYHNS